MGDKYSEADVFFNGDSCLYIIRLRTICISRPKAIEHMKLCGKNMQKFIVLRKE